MKLGQLTIHDFSAFEDASLEFSPGINVFIGQNATGKSHLLKVLYAVCKSHEAVSPPVALRDKLAGVFQPEERQIGRLVRRRVGRGHADVTLKRTGGGRISFRLTTLGRLTTQVRGWPARPGASLFLPSREVLAMYEGFISAFTRRELSFDETYYDACVAMSAAPLRGPPAADARPLLAMLRELLGGRVILTGNRFYVRQAVGTLEAHLVAEGHRKIASLMHLITNGSLARQGFLFWDEPEANLNPHLIRSVVDVLLRLAKAKIQVFVASHDYLLTQRLSLVAETQHGAPIRFFGFSRTAAEGPVRVDQGDTLLDIADNPILREYARYYEDQRGSFEQPAHSTRPSTGGDAR